MLHVSDATNWWRNAVTYQVYTRSFFDSDGDGNGDLNGVTTKLNYLAALGIDAIWLTPFFASPANDQGYDPASYHRVDPRFGSNADLRHLIKTAHHYNIHVIFDLVVNHTSDQHPWFRHALRMQARRVQSGYDFARDPLANVYVFRPVNPDAPDRPPNNWKHFMGDEPAWSKSTGGEWYLHRFTPHQPDLDMRNPLVRRHFGKIVQRWICDQHVDGIRIDVLDHVFHDRELRDFTPVSVPPGGHYLDCWNWHERYLLEDDAAEFAGELSKAIHSANHNAVIISELHYSERVADFSHLIRFLEQGNDLPFNFSLIGQDARAWKRAIDRYLAALPKGACPNFVLSNHDQIVRLADKFGSNFRAILMALLCLGDTGGSHIFLYNGDEIGMVNGDAINASNMVDPVGLLQGVALSRDHLRTGLTWRRDAKNAGYSTSNTPWLPGGQTMDGNGIDEQMADPNSILTFVRDIIALRKQHMALQFGQYIPVDCGDDMFCFERQTAEQHLHLMCNFSDQVREVPAIGTLIHTTDQTPVMDRLQPHEGRIVMASSQGHSRVATT